MKLYTAHDERGYLLGHMSERGLMLLLGLRPEAMKRVERENPCTLHVNRGNFTIVTVTHKETDNENR